jgi:catechol 2,3-dioxygenase-like lactoylglutathione lyase family enzyme
MGKEAHRDERPGLYCVEIRTTNWAALVEWYREVLGLRVLVRVIDDGYALLEAGENRLALVSRRETGPPTQRISLAFEINDVPRLCSRLKRAGAPVTHPTRDPEGLREANTYDPDGNRIRLFSWPGTK